MAQSTVSMVRSTQPSTAMCSSHTTRMECMEGHGRPKKLECASQYARVVTPSPLQGHSHLDNSEGGIPADWGIVILDQIHVHPVVVQGSGLHLGGTGVGLQEHERATMTTLPTLLIEGATDLTMPRITT